LIIFWEKINIFFKLFGDFLKKIIKKLKKTPDRPYLKGPSACKTIFFFVALKLNGIKKGLFNQNWFTDMGSIFASHKVYLLGCIRNLWPRIVTQPKNEEPPGELCKCFTWCPRKNFFNSASNLRSY